MQEFSTPLEWVEFWIDGEKQTVWHVLARDTTDLECIKVQTVEGHYWAFRKWSKFAQAPGASFF